MKTVVKELLKMRLFKVDNAVAVILRKPAFSNGGLELAKLPQIYHVNKLDKDVLQSRFLYGYKYIFFGQTSIIVTINLASITPGSVHRG